MKGRALSTIGLIKNYFSPKLIRKLSQFMHQINYSPGDIIQDTSGQNEMNLFYIYKGKVQCWTENRQKAVKIEDILEKGYFGLENLFRQYPLPYEIKSNDFTVVYCLKKSDFVKTINEPEFRDDYETYRMLLDKMTFDFVETCRCFSCSENTHLTLLCPYLSYMPMKTVAVNRVRYSKVMERDLEFDRERSVKMKRRVVKDRDMKMKMKQLISEIEADLQSINSEDDESKLSWGKQQYRQKVGSEEISPEHSNQFAVQMKYDNANPSLKNLSNSKALDDFQAEAIFSRRSLRQLPETSENQERFSEAEKWQEVMDTMVNSEKYFPQYNCQKVLKRYWQFMMETRPQFFRKKMKKRRVGMIALRNLKLVGHKFN